MAGVIAGQPLDTLRIRLQQRGCAARSLGGAWRAMAAAEGPRALFRGMSYPLYTTSLQNAVTFQAQKAGERGLAAAGAAPGMLSTCAAGMVAGARARERGGLRALHACAAVLCMQPVRPHLAAGRGIPSANHRALKLNPSITPPRASNSMPRKSLALPHPAPPTPAPPLPGAVQTFISSPVELLKIRLQLQLARPGAPDYVGPLGMLRRVLRDEGAAGALQAPSVNWPSRACGEK
jgi:hypothetical protein